MHRLLLLVSLVPLTCAIVPQVGGPPAKGNLKLSVAARPSIDAAAALEETQKKNTRTLISQADVDLWNSKLGFAFSRWTPIVTQWATFGAITGAGAGALFVSGPLGASLAKIYLGSVASGTAWTLAFSSLMNGNEGTIMRMGGVRAPSTIQRVVSLTAQDAGLRQQPSAWVIPSDEPNAFALTSGLFSEKPHAVAVTQGLVDTLTASEVHAVIAHEIGHIRHNDCGRAIQTASMISGLRLVMRVGRSMMESDSSKRDDEEDSSFTAGLMLMGVGSVTWVASNLLALSSSRAAEFAADATAAELVPDGGLHLASALKKIEGSTATRDLLGGSHSHLAHMYIANSPRAGHGLSGFFDKAGSLLSTHPRTTDRVAQLIPSPSDAGVGQVTGFAAFGQELAEVLDEGLW